MARKTIVAISVGGRALAGAGLQPRQKPEKSVLSRFYEPGAEDRNRIRLAAELKLPRLG